jgi:hypothetical protein
VSRIITAHYSLLLLLFCQNVQGQILINTGFNLNVGGKVNDVEYNPYHDGYFVVGSFTDPNGPHATSDNIIFINGDDFTINMATNLNPIVSMDGEIWSVEMERTYNSFCDCYIYHLYLGGNFSTVETTSGTYSRNGLVKLTTSHAATADPFSMSDFDVGIWDADLGTFGFAEDGVYDLDIFGDTLVISGQFFEVLSSSAPSTRDGLAAFNFISGALLTYPAISPSAFLERRITNYQKLSDAHYISLTNQHTAGNQGKIWKLDSSGDIDPSFAFAMTSFQCAHRLRELDDSLIFAVYDDNSFSDGADNFVIVRKADGSEKLDHEFTEDGLDAIGGVCCGKHSIEIHKNYLLMTSGSAGNGLISFEHQPGSGPVSSPNWNGLSSDSPSPSHWGHLYREENVLFVSGSNLTSLSGQSKTGLGLFCLEPADPVLFEAADSSVCPDQVVSYSIPAVEFAEGYEWTYTGNGADLNMTGAPENLYQIMTGETGNTINVEFTDIFTAGQLIVRAYSTCNDNLISPDTLFSKPLIANIISNPIPNADAGSDTSISCAVDSVLLIGSSSTAGCSFEWINSGPYGNTIGTDTLTFLDGEFILKVISPLGCPNYDTVYVVMDTLKPDVILPPGPYELTCNDSNVVLLGSTSITDSTTYWKNVGSGGSFSNPMYVGSPGTYRYIVMDNSNGCADSLDLIMILNQPIPNIAVPGYPPLNPIESLDTLTCFEDTLNLTCASDTLGTIANWTLADTSVLFGDNVDIYLAGNYYILVEDTSTGCTNFTAINIAEFKTPPNAIIPSVGSLNCSVDSLALDGSSTIISADLEWTGSTIPPSPDPVTIFEAGWYFLEVMRPDNGCTVTDSVEVLQDSSISVILPDDTVACDQSPILLTASYFGSLSGLSFLWNNLDSAASSTYIAGPDTIAIVELFADGGCYGTDTIAINIPTEVLADIQTFQPCGDPESGQIIINPSQGAAPFQFSIDGGSSVQASASPRAPSI